MAREIEGTIYRVHICYWGYYFVECSSIQDLFEYVAKEQLKGHPVVKVNEMCKDGSTPKVAVFTNKEYKAIFKRLEKEQASVNDTEDSTKYVFVCYEENYNDLLIGNNTLNALCVKDTFNKAYQFFSKQIESGIGEGFVEDETTVNEPKENIERELAEYGRFSTIMFRGRQENDNESYAIVIERKAVE